MNTNEREIGYVEYEISIYDGDNDLVDIYKAYSEEEKDALIAKHFPNDPWNQKCYVSKKETIQAISKDAIEIRDPLVEVGQTVIVLDRLDSNHKVKGVVTELMKTSSGGWLANVEYSYLECWYDDTSLMVVRGER